MLKTTPLNVKDPEVYRLAKELSDQTGETLTVVVKKALRDRLRNQQPTPAEKSVLVERLKLISDRIAKMPVLDSRSPDEIVGYNQHGLPE
jgi:antitoxin VapB